MDNIKPEVNVHADEVPPVTPMEQSATPAPVSVDQATMKLILDRMEAQDKEIETLRASVSQNKLAEVEKNKKKVGLPTAKLKLFNNKVVVGWKADRTVKPYIFNPTNPEVVVGEQLKTTVLYIDGTDSGLIDQREFTEAKTDSVVGEVKEGLKALLDSEVEEVTLHFVEVISVDEDFKKAFVMPADYKINKKFLNP